MSVLAVALLTGVMLMFLLAQAYSFIGFSVIWTLPLWLMLHSLLYSSFWLGRIVALISRQGSDGLLDEVGVIPPGRVFIYISICKVVLHENDALAWLSIIRKFLAGTALLGLLMPVLVTMYQLDNIDLTQAVAYDAGVGADRAHDSARTFTIDGHGFFAADAAMQADSRSRRCVQRRHHLPVHTADPELFNGYRSAASFTPLLASGRRILWSCTDLRFVYCCSRNTDSILVACRTLPRE